MEWLTKVAKNSQVNRKYSSIAIFLLASIISFSIIILATPNLSSYSFYHLDEGFWIESSKYTFQKMFIERDFSKEQWWTQQLRSFGAVNPNLGKLIFGTALYVNGYREFRGLPKWDFKQSNDWNIKAGNAAPPNELTVARFVVILITSLTVASLFTFTSSLPNRSMLGSLFVCITFLSHPLVMVLGRQVMLDMPAILFSVIAISAAHISVFQNSYKNIIIWSTVAAVFSGLAVSVKLNAALITITVLLIIITKLVHSREGKYIFPLITNLVIPPILFFALNPQLWSIPVAGVNAMLAFGQSIADRRDVFTRDALWTISDRLIAFYQRIFGTPLNISLFVLGIALMFKDIKTMYPLLIYGLTSSLGVILWTPLNWDRYYLPFVPFFAIVIGFLISKAILSLRKQKE